MAQHNDLGRRGEEIARLHLESHGYVILHTNWRSAHAEVDLIASFDERIVFVEVKTRSGVAFGEPEEFVGALKQRNMQFVAERYIEAREYNGEIRFDVISVLVGTDGKHKLRHIEDAFWPGM